MAGQSAGWPVTAGKRPLRIVSGGQTGVDRAALDAALELGVECGGWCPQGRRAEDGAIAERYPLSETPERNYEQRTEWNVHDSDATLILTGKLPLTGGTVLTREFALKHARPFMIVDPASGDSEDVMQWLAENNVATLNVAGPRESLQPGIYKQSKEFLLQLFSNG